MKNKNEPAELPTSEKTIKTKKKEPIPNKEQYKDSLLNYEYDEEDDGVDWETWLGLPH